jgi:conjugative transfer signal peptidase TraF
MREHRVAAAFGDELRRQRLRRKALRRRGVAIALLSGVLGLTIALPPRPLLVWNVTASTPVGLYAISAPGIVTAGDIVLARVPDTARKLAAERRYIPLNVPLVKRVAAVPGDTVCARGATILVNGRPMAERRRVDAMGRPMPWWTGCVTLRHGALFLLMPGKTASFDGRYFGITSAQDVLGKAVLLWSR